MNKGKDSDKGETKARDLRWLDAAVPGQQAVLTATALTFGLTVSFVSPDLSHLTSSQRGTLTVALRALSLAIFGSVISIAMIARARQFRESDVGGHAFAGYAGWFMYLVSMIAFGVGVYLLTEFSISRLP